MMKPRLSLKGRALKYLSMREHSRQELARKLARYAEEGEDVEAVLDSLESARFLSEERFSESLVNRRAARFGNQRILSELQSHGIDSNALADVKRDLTQSEVARAKEVWRRKFSNSPTDASERARQMRFLQQRGFSLGAIRAALEKQDEDEDGDLPD